MKTTCFALFLLFATAAGAAAAPSGPPAGFTIEADYSEKSPDGATTVEQYKKAAPDESYNWQFWARRADSFSFLAPEQENYPADFRFTNDGRWLVRMQKTGSGELTSYLYKLGPNGFVVCDQKTDRRSRLGFLLQPSGIPQDHEAGFSHGRRPPERHPGELSQSRRELAGEPLHRHLAVGRGRAHQKASPACPPCAAGACATICSRASSMCRRIFLKNNADALKPPSAMDAL